MKKIMSITIAIALVAIIGVGASLAYFTDTKSVQNTFTVGDVKISLTEPNFNLPNADHQIVPGKEIAKDPTVRNVGTNSAYIRVKVTIPNQALFPNLNNSLTLKDTLIGFDSTKWDIASNDVDSTTNIRTITLNYNQEITNGNEAVAFTGIKFPTSLTNAQIAALSSFTINITADAIQSEGFTNVQNAFAEFVA